MNKKNKLNKIAEEISAIVGDPIKPINNNGGVIVVRDGVDNLLWYILNDTAYFNNTIIFAHLKGHNYYQVYYGNSSCWRNIKIADEFVTFTKGIDPVINCLDQEDYSDMLYSLDYHNQDIFDRDDNGKIMIPQLRFTLNLDGKPCWMTDRPIDGECFEIKDSNGEIVVYGTVVDVQDILSNLHFYNNKQK